jgi:hypothetical protein
MKMPSSFPKSSNKHYKPILKIPAPATPVPSNADILKAIQTLQTNQNTLSDKLDNLHDHVDIASQWVVQQVFYMLNPQIPQ